MQKEEIVPIRIPKYFVQISLTHAIEIYQAGQTDNCFEKKVVGIIKFVLYKKILLIGFPDKKCCTITLVAFSEINKCLEGELLGNAFSQLKTFTA